MNRQTKLALIPILGIGCIASVAVLVRFAYIEKFRDPDFLCKQTFRLSDHDMRANRVLITGATVDIAIWSTTEQALTITAGSLASLQPLLKRAGQRFGLWSAHGANSRGSNGILPRTIGGSNNTSKLRKKGRSAKDSYGLTTFECEPSENDRSSHDGTGSITGKNQIMLTREVAVTTKRGSMYNVREKSPTGSEEKLTNQSSQETYNTQVQAVPRSFLARPSNEG